MMQRLGHGWNTWNTNSVLSHVLLPDGLAVNLCLRSLERGGAYLREAFPSSAALSRAEKVKLGRRTLDGSYTELRLTWKSNVIDVQSARDGDDLVLLVTVRQTFTRKPTHLIVEAGMIWNRPGSVAAHGGGLRADLPDRQILISATAGKIEDRYVTSNSPYLAFPLAGLIGIHTGAARSLEQIRELMQKKLRDEFADRQTGSETFEAMRSALGWNTIYDPGNDRVISPVSRLWSQDWGGFVLFAWDTYFAAYTLSFMNRELAYANAVEITRSATPSGFVPNFAAAHGQDSNDRSQPPVGSLVAHAIFRRYREKWFLEEIYEGLLRWNEWWPKHRECNGYLCWGSDPVADMFTDGSEFTWQAALYETGLDNSPMYDDVPFDRQTHLLSLADVGLMSLYVADCNELAEIATVLGRPEDTKALRERAARYSRSLASLWNDEAGLFLNKRTDTGQWSHRISPTNFYPLLAKVATQAQAERMIAGHYFNAAEFHGEYVMPSIARSDPAFADQNYWRGRIWPPMNFLVYLGMANYRLDDARKDLAARSCDLMMKSWRGKATIHENYNAITGDGDDKQNSDGFYHWGALLGLMQWLEDNPVAGDVVPKGRTH